MNRVPNRTLRYIFQMSTAGKLIAKYNELNIPAAPPMIIIIRSPMFRSISKRSPFNCITTFLREYFNISIGNEKSFDNTLAQS